MFGHLEYEAFTPAHKMCSETKKFIYARFISSIDKGAMKINEFIKNYIHPKYHADINTDILFSAEINGDLREQDYDILSNRINAIKYSDDYYYSDSDYIDEEIEEFIKIIDSSHDDNSSMMLTLTSDIHDMKHPIRDYSDFYTSLYQGDYFIEKDFSIDMCTVYQSEYK